MPPLHVHGLDRFVDEVHTQFDAWAEIDAFERAVGPDGLAVLRLAVHEWVANLVQHADFCGPADLTVSVGVLDDGVRCEIEDSSSGFDFARQVGAQQTVLDAPAPSERGRGLLMLVSCTEDLEFQTHEPERPQRIAFTVRPPEDDALAQLFRPEDLVLDEPLGLPDPPSLPDPSFGGDGASSDASLSPSPRDTASS